MKNLAGTLVLSIAAILAPGVSQPAYDYDVLEDQTYAQRSFGPLKGDLYLPVTGTALPAVIMIHGGGWRSGDTDNMQRFADRVAKAGFAVFNITYRLAPDHKFPAQLEDVRDAVRWLRTNAAKHNVDPNRIGAWGFSAGAHLAMLLGTVNDQALADAGTNAPSSRVSAVVAGAGPTDLREYPDNHYVTDLMPQNADDALFALASPLAAVSEDDAAMFLYHGKSDRIVGFHNSVNMVRALQSAGVTARLYEMPFGHVLSYLFGADAVEAGIEFLDDQLRHDSGLSGSGIDALSPVAAYSGSSR